LTPQPRTTDVANQAIAVSSTGAKESRLQVCRDAAADYNLTVAHANEIIEHTVSTVEDQWHEAADAARLTQLERELSRGRQILNPYIHYA
jgi:serine/threonine-protein kinase HipA